MRLLTILALIAPLPVFSEPYMVSTENVLGVYGTTEYGENDWNNDGHSDLAVLVISDSGDSVDLYLATSDPETGTREVTEVVRSILPYDQNRSGDLQYSIGPAHELYEPEIILESIANGTTLSILINPRSEAPSILRINAWKRRPDDTLKKICGVEISAGYDNPSAPLKATDIHSSSGALGAGALDFDPGREPLLTEWTYEDLLAPCLP